MSYDVNGMARIDESIAHRRHSLPSNNPHQGIARSLNPPMRYATDMIGKSIMKYSGTCPCHLALIPKQPLPQQSAR